METKYLQYKILAGILAREIAPTATSKALKTGVKFAGASAGVSAVLPPSQEAIEGWLEGFLKEKQKVIPEAAAIGAFTGGLGSLGVSGAKTVGRFVRKVGGISEATMKEAERLGIERVVDPNKRVEGYIGKSGNGVVVRAVRLIGVMVDK